MTGVKGRSGRKKKIVPSQNPPPPPPNPAISSVPLVSTSTTNTGGFVSTSPIPPKTEESKENLQTEQPKETSKIEFTTKEEGFSDVSDLKDLFGKLKPPEDIERERQETDKMLDGLFQSIENMWNRAGETNEKGEIESWRWTKSDSEQLKNSIMLLDAKYGFIGKSINYMPEILFAVTLIMIGMKGFALIKHRRESQRPSFSSPPTPISSPVTNLTQLAEQRARELGGG